MESTVDILAQVINRYEQVNKLLCKERGELKRALEDERKKTKSLEKGREELATELDETHELLAESEIERENHPDCKVCAQDTYEQQQNYERIKEQLYKENEELKKENKEMRWSINRLHANEEDDWGKWRTRAIKLEKELKDANKDIQFFKSCGDASRTLLKGEEQKSKSFGRKIVELKEQREANQKLAENWLGDLASYVKKDEKSSQEISRLKRELEAAHTSISKLNERIEELKFERDKRLPVETTGQIGRLMRKPLLR